MSETHLDRLIKEFAATHKLSKREGQVMALMSQKVISADALAMRLGLSKNTVRIHLRSLMLKLNVQSKAQALAVLIHFIVEHR